MYSLLYLGAYTYYYYVKLIILTLLIATVNPQQMVEFEGPVVNIMLLL